MTLGWFGSPAHFTLPSPAGIDDLAALPIVSCPKSTLPHRRGVQILSSGRRQVAVVHGSASMAIARHLVSQGFGIGTIRHDIVRSWPHAGLQEIRVTPGAHLPDLDFAICCSSGRNHRIGREVTRAALAATAD